MGDPCKMPNQSQFEELTDYTTHTWTTMNGVKGYKFTNKSDSNKYIFLPASGYWRDTTHENTKSFGRYWFISLDSSSSFARLLSFNSDGTNILRNYRYQGQSIRGIQ